MLAVDATNATVAMGVLGLLAVLFREPMIFPSLGATAYLLFAHPHEHQAGFRNAFFGHLVAALIGWLTLQAIVAGFDPEHVMRALEIVQPGSGPSMAHTWHYVAAAAISIGLTLAVMVAAGIEHSPACSTTLLFSLGVFQHFWQIAALMAGVVLLLVCGQTLNRLAEFITNPRQLRPDGGEPMAGSKAE